MRRETLKFRGTEYPFEPGDSVLDCLKAGGIGVASSCYAGSCGACLLRVVRGAVPAQAQSSLHSGARATGEFLSCVCPAETGLEVEAVDDIKSARGRIESTAREGDEVIRVRVALERAIEYRAGQVVHLVHPSEGMSGVFAITSTIGEPSLELYWMERGHGEPFSWFLHADVEEVVVRGPVGHFFYMNDPAEPLVLIASGIAVAPALGVLRAAVRRRHRAPIVFIHLTTRPDEHFRRRVEEEAALADCVVTWREIVGSRDDNERVERALESVPRCLSGARIYLGGEALLLRKLRLQVFGRGADQDRVHRFVLKQSLLTRNNGRGGRSAGRAIVRLARDY